MQTIARYGTRDLARALPFYDALAALLGGKRAMELPGAVGYAGAAGTMFLIGEPFEGEATVGNGAQIGFAAPDRAAVDAVHAKAIELGGKDEGAPGPRGPAEMGFYGAYFRDLDGNKLTVFNIGGN